MGRSRVIVVGGVASVKDLLGHGWGQGSCYWGHDRVGVLSNTGTQGCHSPPYPPSRAPHGTWAPHTLPTWALTNRSGANLIQTSLNPLKYSISVKGEQSKTSVLFHRRNAPPWGGTSISISDSNRKPSLPG